MVFLRKWVTPLTIGAFLLMAVTGVLMFYHKDMGFNKKAHEWLSWAFLVGAILHVMLNIRPFKAYFTRPFPIGVISAFVLVLGLSFISWGGPKPEPPTRAVMKVLSDSSLVELAPLVHSTPEDLMARLKARGYPVVNPDQSPNDIAGGDGKKGSAVLGEIFRVRDGHPGKPGGKGRTAAPD